MNEDDVLSLLLAHFRATGRGEWLLHARPDAESPREPTPDYIIRGIEAGELAAVEITSFDWPTDTSTVHHSIRSACDEITAIITNEVRGTFAIGMDLLAVRKAGVFSRRLRHGTIRALARAIVDFAPRMGVGETRYVTDPCDFSLTRCSDTDSAIVGWTSNTAVDTFSQIEELEAVLADNAQKFLGYPDIPHFIAVQFMGTEERLQLIAPVLELPPTIDEVFFIVFDESAPRVIDYRSIREPEPGLIMDRESRALKIQISFHHKP